MVALFDWTEFDLQVSKIDLEVKSNNLQVAKNDLEVKSTSRRIV